MQVSTFPPDLCQRAKTNLSAHLGGGTVDLISYRISALKPILKIAEAAPGSGSSCGSTFLNRIFQKFLTDRFGDDPNWDYEVLQDVFIPFYIY